MPRRKAAPVPPLPVNDLALLDDLIVKCYRALEKSMSADVKLGDFLKMLELRRKLTTENKNLDDIWSLIQKAREQELPHTAHPRTPAAAITERPVPQKEPSCEP